MYKKEDLHIAILKYGKDKLETGVTFEQIYSYIKNEGYEVSEERMETYLFGNYEPMERKDNTNPMKAMREGAKFTLSVESTFRLIEHDEFKSANRSSRIATYFATAALAVSILSAWASIHLSNKQLNTATVINKKQLTKILQLKYDDKNIINNAEEIIKYQKLIINELQHSNKLSRSTKKPNKALNSDAQKTRAR